MKSPVFTYVSAVVILIGTGLFWHARTRDVSVSPDVFEAQQLAAAQQVIAEPEKNAELTVGLLPLAAEAAPLDYAELFSEPIQGFTSRITKKHFGIYITPETSPIQPDRFTGYHTGADAEYDDVAEDVPVRAVADGMVVVGQFVHGYGGVVVIRHDLGSGIVPLLALYGHLDPASIPQAGKQVKRNEVVGILGDGFTEETDGARKHLHFAMLKKAEADIRGYVKDAEELSGWYDPLEFYSSQYPDAL